MKVIRSTCNYCSIACNFDFHVDENDEIRKVEPSKNYPVNEGFCCVKGLNLDKQNKVHKNPVLPRLRDENGEYKIISWDEAFKTFAERVLDIQSKHGKESFAFLSTGQLATEEMALIGHIGRTFLGGNGDGNTRLCMATSVVSYKQSFGFDAPPYTLKDLKISDVIIFIGANPVVSHPILWSKVRENHHATLIGIDPRRSETIRNCNKWYDIKPKTDIYLLYTLANVLIEKEWIDNNYIEKYTEDFEGFKEHVKKYTLDDVEERTGISKMRVLELAETIHNGKNVSFWWTMGVNQGFQGVRTAQAIINLALMTGNIGRPGTGPNSITGQCNAMGSRAYSNTTCLYGGGDYGDEERRKIVAEALNIDPDMLPKKPTIPYSEIIDRINKGEIKALWVVATNPMVSWINNYEFRKAAEKLEFLVVEDIYDDTDTAKFAHLLLPSANGLKKEGVLINTERRVSKLNPVLPKKENELTDYDIFLGVGKALGMGKMLDPWKTPKDAFETIIKCTKGSPCDMTGMSYELLEKYEKGIQWPFKEGDKLEEDERRLFEDNKFFTPSKKAKFIYEDVKEPDFKVSEEYPFLYNTGRGLVGQWHTLTRTRELHDVDEVEQDVAYVNLNDETAENLGIKDNEKVRISSPNGVSNIFKVKVNPGVKKDHVYAPLHYIECNSVLPSVFDTYSKQPSFKYVPVKIEKIEEEDA